MQLLSYWGKTVVSWGKEMSQFDVDLFRKY